jgi:hypothetical protein
MCQSSGCFAIVPANASATVCIAVPTRSFSRPGPSTGTSGANVRRQPRSVKAQTVGMSAPPVCAARSAAPPGIVAARPKNVTGTPPLPRLRSTRRQVDPPSASQSRSTSELGRGPPVSGTTRMPRDSRYSRKRRYSDSGFSRSATVMNGPPRKSMNQTAAASQFPLCGRAITSPRPSSCAFCTCSRPITSVPVTIRSVLSVGRRKASCQYRA